jgi:hypothetical protein
MNAGVPADMQPLFQKALYNNLAKDYKTANLQDQFTKAPPTQQAKMLANKGEEGSMLRAWLYKLIGFQEGANAELAKLDLPGQWKTAMDADGKTGMVQYSTAGKPLSGVKADGTAMSEQELIGFASGSIGAESLKTLQTQAHHSSATAMDQMRKANAERIDKKLSPLYSDEQILQRGREVFDQTMRVSRRGNALAGTASMTAGTAPTVPSASDTAPTITPNKTATGTTTGTTTTTPTSVSYAKADGSPSMVFANWDVQRVGESSKDFGKRLEIRPEDVELAAQGLAKGQIKPTELSGRQNDFRRVAVERALEINPKYSPGLYDQINKVVQRYTAGKDHDTLVNTGTAVNHLMQFKEIAAQTPGNTDVSSWNTFYQNLMKYGNAPEIKSKEEMAGFVAGELVKGFSFTVETIVSLSLCSVFLGDAMIGAS